MTIERNVIWKVDRSAIAGQSWHWQRNRWFPSLHVVIRENYAEDIGGDGIVPWATDGVLVEWNVVRDCNRRAATCNAGSIGTVVRRNISHYDRERIFHISAVEKVRVEENAIYVGPGLDVQMVLFSDWSGWASGVVFKNNRYYVKGTVPYGHSTLRRPDGHYELSEGWGPATDVIFREGRKVQGVPARDWEGPSFDRGRPAEFGDWLRRHREWLLGLMRAEFGDGVN